jgi:hypothetical protein
MLRTDRIEVIPVPGIVEQVRRHLPPGSGVSVTALPAHAIAETVGTTLELAAAGYDAIPHLADVYALYYNEDVLAEVAGDELEEEVVGEIVVTVDRCAEVVDCPFEVTGDHGEETLQMPCVDPAAAVRQFCSMVELRQQTACGAVVALEERDPGDEPQTLGSGCRWSGLPCEHRLDPHSPLGERAA